MTTEQEEKTNLLLAVCEPSQQTLLLFCKSWETRICNARKLYRWIDITIGKYRDSVAQCQAQGQTQEQLQTNNTTSINKSTQRDYDAVVIALKNILDYSANKILEDIQMGWLFEEAAADWPPSTRYDQWKYDSAYITTQALCLHNPELAFTAPDQGSPAFGCVIEKCATELVRVMIEELLNHLKWVKEIESLSLKKAMRPYLSTQCKSKTPLLLAAENLDLDILSLLLDGCPYLAGMDSVNATIKKTAPGLTNQDKALDAFKIIMGKIDPGAVDSAQIWEAAVTMPSPAVVSYLLKERGSEFVTYENAKIIMEKGDEIMWKEFESNSRKEFMSKEKCDLLHTAVKSRNEKLVADILREYPNQIEVDIGTKGPVYAMQSLSIATKGEKRDKTSPYTNIRNALLHAMICSTSPELGIREIRDILRKSSADDIYLHLSPFRNGDKSFADFVQGLLAHKGRIFRFERILKCVKFPNLDHWRPKHNQDSAADLRVDYSDIKIFFEWLKIKGVQQVVELSVPDRLYCPHSDDDVKYCVDGSHVRVLKWRKLNLYLGNLENRSNLRELHLYSSGNQSVHEQWYRELRKFDKLTKLYVHVVVNVIIERRMGEVKAELQENLNKINAELNYRWTKSPKKSKGEPQVAVTEFDWDADGKGRTYRNLDEITNDVVGPNLAAFIRKFEATFHKKSTHKTKVAVIDSGVVIVDAKGQAQEKGRSSKSNDQTSQENLQLPVDKKRWYTNDLAKHVVNGKSFVITEDDEERVWWHASDPHGTQMARLICSIDPFCELYIIKVVETRSNGVAANLVAEAIDWAIEQEVDVISLSMVIYADTNKMNNAIQRATAKDIVILSSTADEGFKEPKDVIKMNLLTAGVFPIAACDRWGNLLDRSEKDKDNFLFFGNNVEVGQVPFLESSGTISGSSAATAIAAGTASLILAFCRVSKNCNTGVTDERGYENMWRSQMVRKRFTEMCEVSDRKFVVLENLCGKGKNLERADFVDTVNNCFQSQ